MSLGFFCFFFWREKNVEASVDGVLGGYGQVNDADIRDSEAFLNFLLPQRFHDSANKRHLVALGILFIWILIALLQLP